MMKFFNWSPRSEKQNPLANVSRLSVIDDARGGLVYEKYDVVLDLQLQDDNRTLKIFVYPKGE